MFSQRGHADGQQAHEKILNITNHQEIANQTTVRYHLTPVRMAIVKNYTNNKCWQGCLISYTLGGNVNWCNHWGKQCGGFSQNLKQNYHMTQTVLLLGMYLKKEKN